MFDKQNSDIFEYAYTRREFKRRMWTYLWLAVSFRVLRVILISTLGAAYVGTTFAVILIFINGMIFGAALITIIYYRKSVKIESKLTTL